MQTMHVACMLRVNYVIIDFCVMCFCVSTPLLYYIVKVVQGARAVPENTVDSERDRREGHEEGRKRIYARDGMSESVETVAFL